jgi:prolyl 4-hydroxylase
MLITMLTAPAIGYQPGIQRFPGAELELYIRKGFLDAADCAALVERIEAQRRPSTIADDAGYEAFRTSETCDLADDDPFIRSVNLRLAAFAGIDPAFGEPLQGQRYAVGQEFKAHTDTFEPSGADYETYCGRSGNRTWTLMVYLNEVRDGGATRFTNVGKTIQPERGKLLAWNNRTADGGLNPASLHHGMKVRAGTKYVITKWFRERVWVG